VAKFSKIGWTDNTMNFWVGCTKVSEECRNCYIAPIMKRSGRKPFGGPILTAENYWKQPYIWNKEAISSGVRLLVFTCSMSDFFHRGADAWRPAAWDVIRECTQLDWLILTKRPELIKDRLPPDWGVGYGNAWLGVSVGVVGTMHRVNTLKQIPAVIRFISAEPLIERLNFGPHLDGSIHWIISGCESDQPGGETRPMDLEWVRQIDRDCRAAGVAHFFKQYYQDSELREDGVLDGVVRQEWPLVSSVG
jgi:protein gp37